MSIKTDTLSAYTDARGRGQEEAQCGHITGKIAVPRNIGIRDKYYIGIDIRHTAVRIINRITDYIYHTGAGIT